MTIQNGNKGRKVYKFEAIFILLNCCTSPNVICFHPIARQNNCVEHPVI
jgi:hypothetical protein